MANIDARDLARLRTLAKAYGALKTDQVAEMLANKDWIEICNGQLEKGR